MSFQKEKPEPFRAGSYQISVDDLNALVHGLVRQLRGSKSLSVKDFGDRTVMEALVASVSRPSQGNYYRQFLVLEVDDDFLWCTWFDQDVDGSGYLVPHPYNSNPDPNEQDVRIAIAKPYTLQKMPWDGKQVTLNGQQVSYSYTDVDKRTATAISGGATESQVIVPDYFVGDVIYAFKGVSGLYVNSDTNTLSTGGTNTITTGGSGGGKLTPLNKLSGGDVPPPDGGGPAFYNAVVWTDVNTAGRAWACVQS